MTAKLDRALEQDSTVDISIHLSLPFNAGNYSFSKRESRLTSIVR